MVMRADLHAAQAREVAFGLIGADAFILERNRVIDAARIPSGVQGIPTAAFVGMDSCERANVIADVGDGIAFIANDKGKRLALALAHDDNALALARAVRFQAAILANLSAIFRLHVTAEIAAVDFDRAIERAANLFLRHRFAQLVREDEGRLILAVQIARQMQGGNALRTVAEDHDGGQQIDERELAAGKNRAAGDAELVIAGNALELAARADRVGLDTATTRANGFAIGFRPAHFAKGLVSLVLSHREDSLEAQCASGG